MKKIENTAWHLLVGEFLKKKKQQLVPMGAARLIGQGILKTSEWHTEEKENEKTVQDRTATAEKLMQMDDGMDPDHLSAVYFLCIIETLWMDKLLGTLDSEEEAVDLIKLFLFSAEEALKYIRPCEKEFITEERKKYSKLRQALLQHQKEDKSNGT